MRVIEGTPEEIARFFAITYSGDTLARVNAQSASSAESVAVAVDMERFIVGWVQRKRTRGQSDWKRAEAVMRRVIAECSWTNLRTATPESFELWLARQRDDGATGRTINKHLSIVSTFLKYVHSIDPVACPHNWAKGIERCDESDATEGSRFLTREEFATLLAYQDKRAPHRGEYSRFLAYTGLRRSDEARLTRAMVKLDGVPRLEITRRTKNRKPRVVPLHPDLLPIVKARMAGNPHDPLWDERPNFKTLKRDCDKAGINSDRVGWHSFRKLCGSMLAAAGVPLRVAQEILGHSTPVLTARVYQSIEHSDAAEQVCKLPSFGHLSVLAKKKAPTEQKKVDRSGNLADTEGAESVSVHEPPIRTSRQSTGDPPHAHGSTQQRPSAVGGSPVLCRGVPDDLRDIAGHLSSAVEQRFCKARSRNARDGPTKALPHQTAQALADLLEALAQVLRLEDHDGDRGKCNSMGSG